jgi:hypothetical protein
MRSYRTACQHFVRQQMILFDLNAVSLGDWPEMTATHEVGLIAPAGSWSRSSGHRLVTSRRENGRR